MAIKGAKFGAAVLTAASLAWSSQAVAEVPESADPIKIVQNNWTSQLVLSHIAGKLLEDMGYKVEYVPSNNQLQFPVMGQGDVHLQVEVWEGTHKVPFETEVAAGRIVDAGTHEAITREEWWYPTYVEENCPGLPDWKALDACAEMFATAETAPKGRYVGGPVDWGKHHSERIEALGMNFVEVPVGQAATLWAELDAAYKRKEPIVLFNWTPNWVEAKYEGRFVDFPDFAEECLTDPSWGLNPDMIYDCGAPKQGWLKKAVWSGMQEKWPAAFAFVQRMSFTNPQIAEASALVDVDGLTPVEAATKWIEENEEVWKAWIPSS